MKEYVAVVRMPVNRYYLVKADSIEEAEEKWHNLAEGAEYVTDVFNFLDDPLLTSVTLKSDFHWEEVMRPFYRNGYSDPEPIE
jgi:hypothetical protein